MGTNFYTTKGTHIGKRSAAGLYCWDCGKTLCKDGEDGIHTGKSDWQSRCPKCGKHALDHDFSKSTVGVEIGFALPYTPDERCGVSTCSSFSWAVRPSAVTRLKKIKDEYGRQHTLAEFIDMVLANCPIQFMDSIGSEFS